MVYDDSLLGGTLQHLQAVSNRRSPGRRSWTSEVSWEIFCFFRHFNIYKTASWMVLHGSSTRFCSHLVRILNFDLWLHLNVGPVGQDLARILPLSQRGSKSWDHPTFRWMICYLSWNVGTLKSCFTLPKEGHISRCDMINRRVLSQKGGFNMIYPNSWPKTFINHDKHDLFFWDPGAFPWF